ncbi:hypothetical protein [Rhodoferax sp.]|uniref:hypothetical protein n=1 Tax=Rhodoferax sp. TaxID=50421 RepID=UPI00261931D6|nr:hypothetical protein [Rhodoferax sp.]MDD2917832.1 hypothetical protein [Rhodoferax sp.]
MQTNFRQPQIDQSRPANASLLTRWITLAIAACAFSPALVLAQSGKLGSYTGTIKVSGTEIGPEVTYRATVKVSLPVTERDSSSITADFITEDAPNASVQIAQWDSSFTEKSRGADGKFAHWTCSLAAPVEIAMKPTGILNVDLEKKRHELSLTLLSVQDVAFNCVHSQSGAHKKKQGIALYMGTGAPGAQGKAPMPFIDPARLTAKYTLMPTAETKGKYGPIVQEWDLRLVR